MDKVYSLVMLAVWVAGWVYAQGFWSTFFAVLFPPWGWYLVIEKIIHMMGWL